MANAAPLHFVGVMCSLSPDSRPRDAQLSVNSAAAEPRLRLLYKPQQLAESDQTALVKAATNFLPFANLVTTTVALRSNRDAAIARAADVSADLNYRVIASRCSSSQNTVVLAEIFSQHHNCFHLRQHRVNGKLCRYSRATWWHGGPSNTRLRPHVFACICSFVISAARKRHLRKAGEARGV